MSRKRLYLIGFILFSTVLQTIAQSPNCGFDVMLK